MFTFKIFNPTVLPSFDPQCLGIEVTVPAFAASCGLGNIDPQHKNPATVSAQSAIAASVDWPVPPPGSTLATIRPDADSIGAMAVLLLRGEGVRLCEDSIERIGQIDRADRFDAGPWPGARGIPRDICELNQALPNMTFAALSAITRAQSLSLKQRVKALACWIQDGKIEDEFRKKVETSRHALFRSLSLGASRVTYGANDRLARVVSLEPSALPLGYCLAPVVLALNPAFQFFGGPKGRKYTIAQFAPGHFEANLLLQRLREMEPGWGGSSTILGSPQDRPSALPAEVVETLISDTLS